MKTMVTTDSAPKANSILSQAVVSKGLVFVSGQVHVRIDGTLVSTTVPDKLKQIFSNISAILEAAGSNLDKTVKVTIYVTDMGIMPELNDIYPRFFSSELPAREAVCVKQLPLGADIEISVVAEA